MFEKDQKILEMQEDMKALEEQVTLYKMAVDAILENYARAIHKLFQYHPWLGDLHLTYEDCKAIAETAATSAYDIEYAAALYLVELYLKNISKSDKEIIAIKLMEIMPSEEKLRETIFEIYKSLKEVTL